MPPIGCYAPDRMLCSYAPNTCSCSTCYEGAATLLLDNVNVRNIPTWVGTVYSLRHLSVRGNRYSFGPERSLVPWEARVWRGYAATGLLRHVRYRPSVPRGYAATRCAVLPERMARCTVLSYRTAWLCCYQALAAAAGVGPPPEPGTPPICLLLEIIYKKAQSQYNLCHECGWYKERNAICLRAAYAVAGTAHAAVLLRAMQCPVLSQRMALCACYAMSGTDYAYGATRSGSTPGTINLRRSRRWRCPLRR
eukprot:1063074-Rhodomonas_salina.5